MGKAQYEKTAEGFKCKQCGKEITGANAESRMNLHWYWEHGEGAAKKKAKAGGQAQRQAPSREDPEPRRESRPAPAKRRSGERSSWCPDCGARMRPLSESSRIEAAALRAGKRRICDTCGEVV